MKIVSAKSLIVLAVMLVPTFAMAAPTVTFQGEVTAQTCQATVNGNTDSIVLLPAVSSQSLSAVGATAGLTPFTIGLTGCQSSSTSQNITTVFLGHSVTGGSNLGNTGTATNVAIQLTTDSTGGTPVKLNGPTAVSGLALAANATTATYQFGAQYISEAGGATAGSVQAVVEYTINYL